MPVPPEVRRAFQHQIDELLRRADHLTEDAVRRALATAEDTRRRILDRLLQVPADSFTARHLASLKAAVDQAIADLVRRYQGDVSGLLERAHELGIDLGEEPLKAAAAAMRGAQPILPAGLVPRNVLEILQGYSADLITNLGQEARRRISGILSQAALGAVSPFDAIQQIASELPHRSVFKSLEARAETIYRTEGGRVMSAAADARMGQMANRLPRMKKRWVAVMDDRTRPTHASANGQVVGARDTFTVGGYPARFPRDPVLPAQESVNCRCWAVPAIDDEVLADLGA